MAKFGFRSLGVGMLAATLAGVVLVSVPMDGTSVVHAQGAGDAKAKPEEPKAITLKDAENDDILTKLAFGDPKYLSKTIELSLKSKVVEENQGGMMLMIRLSHFTHSKLALKFFESDNEVSMNLSSIALMRCTNNSHLNDVFKRWDKLETEKSEKLRHYRINLSGLNYTPEAVKQLLARAKQDKLPDQATVALKTLKFMLNMKTTPTVDEVDKLLRDPAFAKAHKLRSQLHKPQSSSVPAFYNGWDKDSVWQCCGLNIAIGEGAPYVFDTSKIERGEKQGFEVRFKVLLERDTDEAWIRMCPSADATGIGTDLKGNKRIGAGEKEIQMQNTGRWVDFHFAWVPWRNADGNNAMGSVNTEGFAGGGTHYEFALQPPVFILGCKKGSLWISPGEITRIDRLP